MTLARWGASTAPWMRLAEIEREQVVLGAFQRAASALATPAVAALGALVTRRTSGGPAVLAGPGSVHVGLWLPSPDAVVSCAPDRLVNRHVRPLLAALSKLGAPAHFFGRDWVSVAKRPAAWIGFAHRADTGACLVEAFIAVSHPFAVPRELDGYPTRAADPFLGKAPATLDDLLARPVAPAAVIDVIRTAYTAAYGQLAEREVSEADLVVPEVDAAPPWDALVEEAIGFVGGAARPAGGIAIGGDLMISEDALPRIEAALEAAPEATGEVVATTLSEGGFVMEGVRDPASLVRAARPSMR